MSAISCSTESTVTYLPSWYLQTFTPVPKHVQCTFATAFLDGVVLFVAAPEDESGGRELKSFSYKIFRNLYNIGLFINFTAIFLEDLPCLGVRNLNTRVHKNIHGSIVNCFEFVSSKKV